VIESGPDEGGLLARFGHQREDPYVEAGGTTRDLETAGFRPVRVLGEREGHRFLEGIRP